MKTSNFSVPAIVLFGIFLFGCATEKRDVPVSDPAQSFELGRLSFLAPSGKGWVYKRDSSPPIEFMLFKNDGRLGSPRFGVMVWEFHADNPVTSDKELWDYVLSPYRDATDATEQYNIQKTECDHDESLTKMGLICRVEGKHDVAGSFWATGVGPREIIDFEGHVYAFVYPDDDRLIGVLEYFQQVLPKVPPADTKQLLGEFARNVTLLK